MTHKTRVLLIPQNLNIKSCLYYNVNVDIVLKYVNIHIYIFSRNLVEHYCKCCILIGYATRYLFVDRQRVAKMASASRFCKVSKDEVECLLESAVPEKAKNVLCKVFLLKQLD